MAELSELDEIMKIYSDAQAFMASNGNPQWPAGFPDKTDVTGGILGGILYCVKHSGEIAAVFSAVNYDGDYDGLEGKWLTGGNYLAGHRVAVQGRCKIYSRQRRSRNCQKARQGEYTNGYARKERAYARVIDGARVFRVRCYIPYA